jgi:DNA-binding MarR family transcriptional regulator
MMTRKDYVATAEILAGFREDLLSIGDKGEHIFTCLIEEFSEMFLADNERFMADRFEDACWGDED